MALATASAASRLTTLRMVVLKEDTPTRHRDAAAFQAVQDEWLKNATAGGNAARSGFTGTCRSSEWFPSAAHRMIRRPVTTPSFASAGLTLPAALPMAAAGQVEAAHGPDGGAEDFGRAVGSRATMLHLMPARPVVHALPMHADTAGAPPLPVLELANAQDFTD